MRWPSARPITGRSAWSSRSSKAGAWKAACAPGPSTAGSGATVWAGCIADADDAPLEWRARQLKIRLQQPRRAVAQADRQRVAVELGERQSSRGGGDLGDLGGEVRVVQLDVELEVQAEAARVPVGAADQRP